MLRSHVQTVRDHIILAYFVFKRSNRFENEFAENNVYADSNFGCSTFSPCKGTVPKNFNERSYNENKILSSKSEFLVSLL